LVFVALVPFLVGLVGVAFVVALVQWWRSSRQDDRRSPLARDLLRPPGYSLRQKIAVLDSDINLNRYRSVFHPAPPLLGSSQCVLLRQAARERLRIAVSVSAGILAEVLLGRKLLRLLTERRSHALGLDGDSIRFRQSFGSSVNI
jgi:hypothetical protein